MSGQIVDQEWPALRGGRFEELLELLRVPSISTDPSFAASCRECADWVQNYLQTMGLDSEILETGRQPAVYARREVPGAPTLLFYGHYDVQPVDPLDAWQSPPFEPEVRGRRLYARGAQDNKGQLFYFLSALRSVIDRGALGYSVTVLIEGEEECGSTGVSDCLASWRDKLQADILLVCDTGTRSPEVETITVGLRGIVGLGFELLGARSDLHSGVHGGVAPNPAIALAKLLAGLHDSRGTVAIPGFYDGVQEPSTSELQGASSFALSDEQYEALTGVRPRGGEIGLSFGERRGLRPTLEVVGLYSGYSGAGIKTIIPARAGAKLSARLVPGQEPSRICELLENYVRSQIPDYFRLEVLMREVGGPALRVDPESEPVHRAAEILKSVGSGDVDLLWEGASIPFLAELSQASGAQPLLVGFGLEEDQIHAPNESFCLDQFQKGFEFCEKFLSK